MKLFIGFVAALSWFGTASFGFYLLLNSMDRSVSGWFGMLFIILMTLSCVSTGILMLMFAKTHPRFSQAGWFFIVLPVLVWSDPLLAFWAMAICLVAGIWYLIRWFRYKPQVSDREPQALIDADHKIE